MKNFLHNKDFEGKFPKNVFKIHMQCWKMVVNYNLFHEGERERGG